MADFNSISFTGSMPLLREVTAERLNAILTEIRRTKPLPGRGVSCRQTGSGIVIDALAQSSDPKATLWPDFSLYASKGESGNLRVGVTNGMIKGQLPTGMTTGATRGSEDSFYVTVTESGYVYAKVVVDEAGTITALTVEAGETVPEDTETIGYFALGDFGITDGVLTIGSGLSGRGSQDYRYCAGSHIFW